MFNFLTKQLLKRQLKGVPQDQQDMIMALMEKHPDFFKKIAEEVKAKKKAGLNDQLAMMQVMMAHKGELQKMMQGLGKK